MIKICLFDLDQTLLRTDDMKEVRESGKGVSDAGYLAAVNAAFSSKPGRHIYSLANLMSLRKTFQEMKLGVFTRAPRSYAKAILDAAYPGFGWDIIVAYEDVTKRKPYGEGIDKAMHAFGVENLDEVALVGDESVDVRAAYNAGCLVVIDKGAWPSTRAKEHWRSLDLMPDAIIDGPEELSEVVADWTRGLPELERLLSAGGARLGEPRFGKVNKFIPTEAGGDSTHYPIYSCGRHFAKYSSISERRKWHELSLSIEAQKEAQAFPAEWAAAVRTFISSNFTSFFVGTELHVTVVPHRPGRKPRLELFLAELESLCSQKPPGGKLKLHFHPGLLAYKQGVKSHSKEHLGQLERFANVRDNLFVAEPKSVSKGARVLVIDDVSTTGASLIYANRYLKEAGASEVTCLSIAMNIGDVLYG